jgi:Mn2+/Fe2+ NRAMP family transporter
LRPSWRAFSSGIVTGASDSDPSAVVACTQVGASTGYTLLWLFPFTTVALVWLESLASRIGFQRQLGLSSLMERRLGATVAWSVTLLFVSVNVVTIGADLAGCADVTADLTGLPRPLVVVLATALPALLLVGGSFSEVRRFLLFLAPLYLLYIVAAVAAGPRLPTLPEVGRSVPHTWNILVPAVGVVGSVLTPYVFFWQVEDSTQQVRRDGATTSDGGAFGMVFANVVLFFVVLTAAATLHRSDASGSQLQTLRQAGDALRPLLGRGAVVCFSLALLSSAVIAVPVIAAVCGYAVTSLTHRRTGLNWPVGLARTFYGATLVSLAVGGLCALLEINPVRPLYWAQVANGFLLPLLVAILFIESRRPRH